jgi:hypothetical protein
MDPKLILTEVDASMTRLTQAAIVDQKKELLGNLYPLLKLTVQALNSQRAEMEERIVEVEDVLAEVIAGAESRIQPRLAKRIHMALSIGGDLVAKLAAMHADEEQFKGFQLPDEILMTMQAYQQAMITAAGMVGDVTIEVLDDEEEEETADAGSGND